MVDVYVTEGTNKQDGVIDMQDCNQLDYIGWLGERLLLVRTMNVPIWCAIHRSYCGAKLDLLD